MTRNSQRIFFLIVGLFLILIAGFRSIGIDRDSLTYVIELQTESFDLLSKEPTFYLIKELNNLLFNNEPQIFFLLFAILGVSLKLFAINRISSLPFISLYTYICLYFILHEMTQIRVGVASAMFLLAIPDIESRNLRRYIIKIIIATTFHYSAFFLFFIYLINTKKINRLYFFILPVIGFILAFQSEKVLHSINLLSNFLPIFLSSKITIYSQLLDDDNYNKINIFNFYYISLIIIYIFALIHFNKFKSKYDILLIKILGIQIFVFYSCSSIPAIAFRLSELLGVVLIVLIPHIILTFKRHWAITTLLYSWLGIYFWKISILRILNFQN